MQTVQIKYVGFDVAVTGRIRDPRYRLWNPGETKEVPDVNISCSDELNQPVQENAIRAIFNHGFMFVDASTGKNPLFTCVDCEEKADHDFFRLNDVGQNVEYKNADGDPLCVTCFLARNPQHIKYHAERGMAKGHLNVVDEKRAKLEATQVKAAGVSMSSPAPTLPPPAATPSAAPAATPEEHA